MFRCSGDHSTRLREVGSGGELSVQRLARRCTDLFMIAWQSIINYAISFGFGTALTQLGIRETILWISSDTTRILPLATMDLSVFNGSNLLHLSTIRRLSHCLKLGPFQTRTSWSSIMLIGVTLLPGMEISYRVTPTMTLLSRRNSITMLPFWNCRIWEIGKVELLQLPLARRPWWLLSK